MATTTTVGTVDAGKRRVARQVELAASPPQIFALLTDPRRHGQLDGSGTVGHTVSGPDRLYQGAKFSVNMTQMGIPYRITSTVIACEEDRLIEWRHPFGHTWRWELSETSPNHTTVTETFDYSRAKPARMLELFGMPARNATGITHTLQQLQAQFPD
jgi:hypothetical protein